MKNFIQQGNVLSLLAPYAVASGAPFKVGSIVAVAVASASSGGAVEGMSAGVFTLPKVSAQAWAVGDKIYWDDSAKLMTTTALNNTLVGCATAVAGNPTSTGQVYLDGAIH